jgi:hypothetical protein
LPFLTAQGGIAVLQIFSHCVWRPTKAEHLKSAENGHRLIDKRPANATWRTVQPRLAAASQSARRVRRRQNLQQRRAMAGDWFVAYGTNHHWPCITFLGCYLVHALEGELEIVALLAIEDR